MTVRILVGNCLDRLREIPDASLHSCTTSPPYWGLRDYGVPPSIWGGDPACEHVFGGNGKRHRGGPSGKDSPATAGRAAPAERDKTKDINTGAFCSCGAWRGCLGLEPTPELYVEHIVQIFREVWRVLRPDGTLWLNLGDCYATAGGVTNTVDPKAAGQGGRVLEDASRLRDDKRGYRGERLDNGRGDHTGDKRKKMRAARFADLDSVRIGSNRAQRGDGNGGVSFGPMTQPNRMPIPGLKPKDLVGIPWMVAFALRKDGWWLRRDIIWNKPNPMPESTKDRPTTAHEYIFLLTKAERYYFDFAAIAEPAVSAQEARWDPGTDGLGGDDRKTGASTRRFRQDASFGRWPSGWTHADDGVPSHSAIDHAAKVGRSGNAKRKNASERGVPENGPLAAGNQQGSVPSRNKRSVWTIDADEFFQFLAWKSRQWVAPDVWKVGTYPYPEAHFATFPPDLIEPCILAGVPQHVCPHCGEPWVMALDTEYVNPGNRTTNGPRSIENRDQTAGFEVRLEAVRTAVVMTRACDCAYGVPVPGTVLDPFGGAGTTGLVADRNHRHAVLVELKPEYADMADRRITGEVPLFAMVERL